MCMGDYLLAMFPLSGLKWYFQVYDSAWLLYALYRTRISNSFSSIKTILKIRQLYNGTSGGDDF